MEIPTARRVARGLELIGFRALYWLLSQIFPLKLLPSIGNKKAARPHEEELWAIIYEARYFGYSNFYRLTFLSPLLIGLWIKGAENVSVTATFIGGLHATLCLNEFYRYSLARGSLSDANPTPLPKKKWFGKERPDKHWFYSPKYFEIEPNYIKIGFERFRKFVVRYVRRTSGKKGDSLPGGHTLPGVNSVALCNFEGVTRIGETVHWCMATSMFFIATGPFPGGWILTAWATAIGSFDCVLALLQRYHRSRVMAILDRIESRKALQV